LRKQLQERIHIDELAEQIKLSSGNINTLVAKIGASNQGDLQEREESIANKEKEVDEKRR
jgi:short-subunit dehydrogenase involved in D-alanine esterification of teichoic acids